MSRNAFERHSRGGAAGFPEPCGSCDAGGPHRPRRAGRGNRVERWLTGAARDAIMDDIETFSVAALVAPHPLAATAGRDVLIEGGSVVEAAIAAAAVSAVVLPHRNGLGGDALWLVREAGTRGRVRVLDARGVAGEAATPSRYRRHDAVPLHGPDAVITVPGAVAGWAAAHDLSTALGGRLPLSRLLAPAVAAARDGVDLPGELAEALTAAAPNLSALPGFASMFLADGEVPKAGARRRWPALAETLAYLVHGGLDDLYRGDVGRELGADLEEAESPLTRADLRRAEARWRPSASLDLGRDGVDVASNRSDLEVAVALGLLAGLRDVKPDSFDQWHCVIESIKYAKHIVLDGVASERDLTELLDADRLKLESRRIDRGRAGRSLPWTPPLLVEEAVWVGAVDRDGSAVSLVQSLGSAFGSGVVSGRTGLLLGNRGAGLVLDPRLGSLLAPGRRPPLASVPALLASRDGRVTSLGATGRNADVTVAQLAARLMLGASTAESVAAPRFGFGAVPDGPATAILVGEDFDSALASRLRAAGHRLEPGPNGMRNAGAVSRLPNARVEAVSDTGEAACCAGL
jgi:gamma-glutamyltranspeptidase